MAAHQQSGSSQMNLLRTPAVLRRILRRGRYPKPDVLTKEEIDRLIDFEVSHYVINSRDRVTARTELRQLRDDPTYGEAIAGRKRRRTVESPVRPARDKAAIYDVLRGPFEEADLPEPEQVETHLMQRLFYMDMDKFRGKHYETEVQDALADLMLHYARDDYETRRNRRIWVGRDIVNQLREKGLLPQRSGSQDKPYGVEWIRFRELVQIVSGADEDIDDQAQIRNALYDRLTEADVLAFPEARRVRKQRRSVWRLDDPITPEEPDLLPAASPGISPLPAVLAKTGHHSQLFRHDSIFKRWPKWTSEWNRICTRDQNIISCVNGPPSETQKRRMDEYYKFRWETSSISTPRERFRTLRCPTPPNLIPINEIEFSDGRLVNRYPGILGRSSLGHGGQANVFRCRHRVPPGRVLALKAYKQPDTGNPMADAAKIEEVEREIRQEFKYLRELSHHNIVEAYTMCLLEHRKCLVLEKTGPTVYRLITSKLMTTDLVFMMLRDALYGLEMCHDRRVIHHDIAPDNIVAIGDVRNGHVDRFKLIDFGFAKEVGSERRPTGKERYLPPECHWQTRQRDEFQGLSSTGAIDIWALFCTAAAVFDLQTWDHEQGYWAHFDWLQPAYPEGIPSFIRDPNTGELIYPSIRYCLAPAIRPLQPLQGMMEWTPSRRLDATAAIDVMKKIRSDWYSHWDPNPGLKHCNYHVGPHA